MELRILHTSDLHLGMKFSQYPDLKEELAAARFEALNTLVRTANEEKCGLFVIAGVIDAVSRRIRDRTSRFSKGRWISIR